MALFFSKVAGRLPFYSRIGYCAFSNLQTSSTLTYLPKRRIHARAQQELDQEKSATITAEDGGSFCDIKSDMNFRRSGSDESLGFVAVDEPSPIVEASERINDAVTCNSDAVLFSQIADAMENCANTKNHKNKSRILFDLLRFIRQNDYDSLSATAYLFTNSIAPPSESKELRLATKSLLRSLADSSAQREKYFNITLANRHSLRKNRYLTSLMIRKRTVESLRKEWTTGADLGDLAVSLICQRKREQLNGKPLTVHELFGALNRISESRGANSSTGKILEVIQLLAKCYSENEIRFLYRILSRSLRIGIGQKSILKVLGRTLLSNAEEACDVATGRLAEECFINAYSIYPDFNVLINVAKNCAHDLETFKEHFLLKADSAVTPMMPAPTTLEKLMQQFKGRKVACEYKYDGQRLRIHWNATGKKVAIFCRSRANVSDRFADIVAAIRNVALAFEEASAGVRIPSFIIDCEVTAYDPATETILPFQVLNRRKKKIMRYDDGEIKREDCDVRVFAFDILLDGEDDIRLKTYAERQHHLTRLLERFPNVLFSAEGRNETLTFDDSVSKESIEKLLRKAVNGNAEGLVCKDVASVYESKQSDHWLKLKKDYMDSIVDTVDLVVVGVIPGRGKRSGNFGSFLLGCYDPLTRTYQTVSKVASGLTDKQLQQWSKVFSCISLDEKPDDVITNGANIDFADAIRWVKPEIVWEVKVADLSVSSVYVAASELRCDGRGISLRFGRFVRDRDDKRPDQATTPQQLLDLFNSQAQLQVSARCSEAKQDRYS